MRFYISFLTNFNGLAFLSTRYIHHLILGVIGGEGWLGGGGGGWLGGEEGIIFLGGYEVWIIFLTFEIDFFIAKKRIYIMTSVLPDSGSH